MRRVEESLKNKHDHYLYPFFWQKGQSHEKILEYMDKMYEQGIHNVCIESRPHPEFLEDGWWKTMDVIIEDAKKKDMKIWILDDAQFPTGYANGKVPEDLKKTYLACRRFDIVGANPYAELDLTSFVDMRQLMSDQRHQKDKFLKAFLVENKCGDGKSFYEETITDISNQFYDHALHLHLENKHYSVFVLYETLCGESATKDYLDPMRKEATQILLNEVYEKHYQHYQDEFGKTIVGFFSDEPRFGNMKGTTASIGREDMVIPWNQDVYNQLKQMNHEQNLAFLFVGDSEEAHQIRFDYMDIVTNLYSENFSQYIGKWCQDRGVDYVGHTIEDNNAHARLGYGTGHYFRGIAGQTMAGIDIIGGQVVPGMNYQHDAFNTGGSDGEFYHYALVKMGASCAKLDPRKNGKLMCEAFGAYGWIEGLKMMKWITDHMISHGVNVIVPHAFDPADFPDWDCPPHFYAHGNNPQYPYFHKWSSYADRLCHLMSGGYHYAKIGVLYHAFAEWSGDYMLMQKVLKELQQHQISCDVISEDYLMNANIQGHSYLVNDYAYDVLVIPYAQRLPEELLSVIKKMSSSVKVIFVDATPQNLSYDQSCDVVSLNNLSQSLVDYKDVEVSNEQEHLVTYRYCQEDGNVYMLSNEDVCNTIHTQIKINEKDLMIYDAYTNETYACSGQVNEDGMVFDLTLEPYQSLILFSGHTDNKGSRKGELIQYLDQAYVSFKAFNEESYSEEKCISFDIDLTAQYPRFVGSIKYECDVCLEDKNVILVLEDAYEVIEVIVNGESVQTLIAPPYVYDLSSFVTVGENHIEMIAINNLARQQRDSFSSYLALEPIGINKGIKLYKKVEE